LLNILTVRLDTNYINLQGSSPLSKWRQCLTEQRVHSEMKALPDEKRGNLLYIAPTSSFSSCWDQA